MNEDELDSIIDRKISLKKTSICAFKCVLKPDSSERKMASESSNTSGTVDTPFLLFRRVNLELFSLALPISGLRV